jgi:6,7-dimethyl-8-ribityllumazine synthase
MRVIDSHDAKIQFPVGIVVSRFNIEFTQPLLDGALKRLQELGFTDEQITVIWVPGAVEAPLAAQRLAELGTHEAIIVLGAVIQGETDHYQYVCQQASHGCQRVALQNDLPVIFGVLTTQNEAQAKDRIGGKHGHKGVDAVNTAVEIVSTLRQIS